MHLSISGYDKRSKSSGFFYDSVWSKFSFYMIYYFLKLFVWNYREGPLDLEKVTTVH